MFAMLEPTGPFLTGTGCARPCERRTGSVTGATFHLQPDTHSLYRDPEKPTDRSVTPAEMADAATTAALVFAMIATGRLLGAGTFFQLFEAVAVSVLAARRRTRVVAYSGFGTAVLGILLGGFGPVTQAVMAHVLGGTTGAALRRGRGVAGTIAMNLAITWPTMSTISVGLLAIFTEIRSLWFDLARNIWNGVSTILGQVGLEGTAAAGSNLLESLIRLWYVFIPLAQIPVVIIYALLVRRLGGQVLRRVDRSLGPATDPISSQGTATPSPLPVHLAGAHWRPTSGVEWMGPVDLDLDPGDHLIIVGPNGVGKTTLLHALAGLGTARLDLSDEVRHPGLGRPGGTALIGQNPAAQVLAPRVSQDVAWGILPRPDTDTIAAVLSEVGLAAMEDRDTSTLSGGELQRLAIANSLLRGATLLLADEATAMLDPDGRAQVAGLLRGLPGRGTTVVQSTHRPEDIDRGSRILRLGPTPAPRKPAPTTGDIGDPILVAHGVSHVHDAGSPWARPALHRVSLVLREGELVLVKGANGSGKTTLAWILAGLTRPTTGRVTYDGAELDGPRPEIGIAFQHPRLQMMRPTVRSEVAASAGGEEQVDRSLALLGLDPTRFGDRVVDTLSGGEQRRVVLAGLVARGCRVLLLDEPLAGLDTAGRNVLARLLTTLRSQGLTIVVVTHDPLWGRGFADRTVELAGGRLLGPRRSGTDSDPDSESHPTPDSATGTEGARR